MKKAFAFALIAVFFIVPYVSFAKTTMTDDEMSAITGSAGVTIDFSNLILGSSSGSNSWDNQTSGSLINDLRHRRIPFRTFLIMFLNSHKGHRGTGNTSSGSSSSGGSGSGGSSMNGTSSSSGGTLVVYAH